MVKNKKNTVLKTTGAEIRKKMPPGTKVVPDKKKEESKKFCRKKTLPD